MTDWLVRTAQNRLTGPISEEDLKKRILAGEYRLEDEICRANSYWIFLHEQEEVKAFLGVDVPRHRVKQEEETETGTSTVTDTTLPGRKVSQPATKPNAPANAGPSRPAAASHPESQSPALALLLTLGGLGLVIFVVFMLRAVWLVSR